MAANYNNESFNTAGSSGQKVVEMVEQGQYFIFEFLNNSALDKKTLQRLRNNVLNLNKMVDNLCNKEANVDSAKKAFKAFSDQIQQDYE